MDQSITILLIMLFVFGGVALATYVTTRGLTERNRIRQRFDALSTTSSRFGYAQLSPRRRMIEFDPARLGFDTDSQRRLRRDLIRAGIFSQDGVALYVLVRWSLLSLLPLTALAVLVGVVPHLNVPAAVTAAAILVIIAYYLPSAFISRRQRLLQEKYRVTFPDFLDMLVVCVNAGLGLDAALQRVTLELGSDDNELRANLELMAGEMRAGKGAVEALKDLADRLGLPEALSLATLLQQSLELGTDVSQSLTAFSDEMRDKRMSRAEEKAASLPPKLTLPLGLFIFPVVLIVILTPVVIRIMRVSGV